MWEQAGVRPKQNVEDTQPSPQPAFASLGLAGLAAATGSCRAAPARFPQGEGLKAPATPSQRGAIRALLGGGPRFETLPPELVEESVIDGEDLLGLHAKALLLEQFDEALAVLRPSW